MGAQVCVALLKKDSVFQQCAVVVYYFVQRQAVVFRYLPSFLDICEVAKHLLALDTAPLQEQVVGRPPSLQLTPQQTQRLVAAVRDALKIHIEHAGVLSQLCHESLSLELALGWVFGEQFEQRLEVFKLQVAQFDLVLDLREGLGRCGVQFGLQVRNLFQKALARAHDQVLERARGFCHLFNSD